MTTSTVPTSKKRKKEEKDHGQNSPDDKVEEVKTIATKRKRIVGPSFGALQWRFFSGDSTIEAKLRDILSLKNKLVEDENENKEEEENLPLTDVFENTLKVVERWIRKNRGVVDNHEKALSKIQNDIRLCQNGSLKGADRHQFLDFLGHVEEKEFKFSSGLEMWSSHRKLLADLAKKAGEKFLEKAMDKALDVMAEKAVEAVADYCSKKVNPPSNPSQTTDPGTDEDP